MRRAPHPLHRDPLRRPRRRPSPSDGLRAAPPLAALLVPLLLLTAAGCGPALVPGEAVEATLAGGEERLYRVPLEAGHHARIEVLQDGIDVVLYLQGPDGEIRMKVDSPNGRHGPEEVLEIAPEDGAYRLRVVSPDPDAQPGRYRVLLERRPAGDEDRLRLEGRRAFFDGKWAAYDGRPGQALPLYGRAIERFRALGDLDWLAEALERAGRAHVSRGDSGDAEAAEALYRRALAVYDRLGRGAKQAILENRLGNAAAEGEDPERAVVHYRHALELFRALGDDAGVAAALTNLAAIDRQQGRFREALERVEEALDIHRRLGDGRSEAGSLMLYGYLLLGFNQPDAAEEAFRRALELSHRGDDPRRRFSALKGLAEVDLQEERFREAEVHLRRSLDLRRRFGGERDVGAALHTLGNVHREAGRAAAAERAYREALDKLPAQSPDREPVLLDLAYLHAGTGRAAKAAALYGRVLETCRFRDEPACVAAAHLGLAEARRDQGRLEEALHESRQALDGVQSLRREPAGALSRATYRSFRQRYYESHVDLLVEMEQRRPGWGYGEEAFRVAEESRAQSLLEMLAMSCPAAGGVRSRELEAELDALRRRISALAGGGRAGTGESTAGLLLRLDEVQGELDRACDPRRPEVLDVDRIRRRVLDPDSTLLAYFLGERRSFLWTVSAGDFALHVLPSRKAIEEGVTRARRTLRSPLAQERERGREELEALSDILLGPVAVGDGARRLLIVADGPLHYLPFAALPAPGPAPEERPTLPLVVHHEIVHLPSASVLATLRESHREPHSPVPRSPHLVTVVADPVYSRDDPRLGPAPGPALASSSPSVVDLVSDLAPDLRRGADPEAGVRSGLVRLPDSAREAAAILDLARGGPSLLLTGFDASRQRVLEGALGTPRILHFATHGVADEEHPELSSLVLSRFGPDGRPRDGFLRGFEIASLNLPAELVVLSACETGLGRELRGEGLVGLTQSFFSAGARRLVTSLWQVNDRGTGELMRRFYAALLVDGLPPAAALRKAQISMWRDGEWEDPRYWAPFVFSGEWEHVPLD